MADRSVVTALLQAGPFNGLDTHAAGPYAPAGSAVDCTNADTQRSGGALSNFFGRALAWTFSLLGADKPLSSIARYDFSPTQAIYIAQAWQNDGSARTSWYTNQAEKSLSSISTPFWQSIQLAGNLYLNNGQQAFGGTDGYLHVAAWQYPAPDASSFSVYASAGTLPAGTYYYAFVRNVVLPTFPSDTIQQTRAVGADVPYPFYITLDAPGSVTLNGAFVGVTDDGYAYTTDVYRQSALQPVWYYETTLTTNDPFVDQTADSDLTANQVLTLTGDVPPVSGTVQFPIEAHQNRAWILAYEENSATNGQPQIQLWYSNDGEPWVFDAVYQVELVGNASITRGYVDAVQSFPAAPYGNQPMGLAHVGSYLIVFFTNTIWMVTGVDQSTYTPLPLFNDIGCVAKLSIAKGNGLVFWLSQQGVLSYDGANLQYLSDAVYTTLQSLPLASLAQAVGAYANLWYFLSFPDRGFTLAYYLPTKVWTQLPYAMTCTAYNPSQSSSFGNYATGQEFGQIIAGRAFVNEPLADAWLDGGDQDLGEAPVVTWTTPTTDSGIPSVQKHYKYVTVSAPPQNASAFVEFFVDPPATLPSQGNVTWTFDLSHPQSSQFLRIPQEYARGYTCALRLTVTGVRGEQIIVWSANVSGDADRAYVQPV